MQHCKNSKYAKLQKNIFEITKIQNNADIQHCKKMHIYRIAKNTWEFPWEIPLEIPWESMGIPMGLYIYVCSGGNLWAPGAGAVKQQALNLYFKSSLHSVKSGKHNTYYEQIMFMQFMFLGVPCQILLK